MLYFLSKPPTENGHDISATNRKNVFHKLRHRVAKPLRCLRNVPLKFCCKAQLPRALEKLRLVANRRRYFSLASTRIFYPTPLRLPACPSCVFCNTCNFQQNLYTKSANLFVCLPLGWTYFAVCRTEMVENQMEIDKMSFAERCSGRSHAHGADGGRLRQPGTAHTLHTHCTLHTE